MGSVAASFVLIASSIIGINDFYYFKKRIMHGTQKKAEYEGLLTQHYRIFMFGDFVDIIDDYDWIDQGVFMVATFIIIMLYTNVLIAFMGDAHAQVQDTIEICEGQGTAEHLIELETIYSIHKKIYKFIMAIICCRKGNDAIDIGEGYILCAEYHEDIGADAETDRSGETISGINEVKERLSLLESD